MAHFNHAFGKSFYSKALKAATTGTGATAVQNTSASLTTIGDFAFIDGKYDVLPLSNVASQIAGFYLAQAAFQPNDKIGNNPGHGGYKESSKSKLIKPKYISNMWITKEKDETAATGTVHIKPTAQYKSCFPCGTDPILRIDIKGTAALRLLNHNAYASLSGSLPMPGAGAATGVPAVAWAARVAAGQTDVDMCCVTQDATHSGIAPSIVAANFVDQFNNDPILSQFGTAVLHVNTVGAPTVFAPITQGKMEVVYQAGALGTTADQAAVSAAGEWHADNEYKVVITLKNSCELQTQFTSCSFDTRDFYLMGGLKVSADLQDEVGNPCVACQGYVIESSTDFSQRTTSSDTAINDILLTESYRQSPYNQGLRDSSRFREQEGMSGIITELGRDNNGAGVSCVGEFRVYHLLHNIPRFNNPNGVFDNDQYHYKIYVKHDVGGTVIADLNKVWENLANASEVTTLAGDAIVTTFQELEDKGGDF